MTRAHFASSSRKGSGGPATSGTSGSPCSWMARVMSERWPASCVQAVKASFPPGLQHPRRFGQRDLGVREVEETEVARHGVEARILEGHVLRVAEPELGPRPAAGRLGYHVRGEIRPHHRAAAHERARRDDARPAGQVEQARAETRVHGVEQGRNRLRGDDAEQVVVFARSAVPARALELAEDFGVVAGSFRSCPLLDLGFNPPGRRTRATRSTPS